MFKTRCISGVILVIIALITLITGGPVLLLTLFGISCIGYYELSKACKVHTDKKVNALEVIGYLSIGVLYILVNTNVSDTIILMWSVMTFFALLGVYVFAFPKYHATQIMASFFILLYALFVMVRRKIYKESAFVRGVRIILIIVLLPFVLFYLIKQFGY